MTLSYRSAVVKMSGYEPGEQPQAGKFIKLNTNENPYDPPPGVGPALQASFGQGLGRYPDPFATAFRRQAAEVLDVDPDWLICGNGSDDLLTILTRTFVDEGDVIRMPFPSYSLYKTLAEIQGAAQERITFNDDWSLDEHFSQPSDRLKLVFLANPNSPSGTVLSPEAVGSIAKSLPCPLVVDEAYVDFAESHCLGLVPQFENVIVTRSLSKSYALAGLRFGFAVAQPQVITQLAKVKDSYNCDALAIAAATAAIADQAWLGQCRVRIQESRARLESRLANLGFDVQPSQANFVWCRHPEYSAKELFQQLRNRRILVRYMSYPGWGDGLRITVGTDEQLDACLSVLASILQA